MIFFGTGKKDYENYLKEYVFKHKMENIIHFRGYKSNLRELLSEYDIGMMCSRSEGFGRTTVEYMASGLITIASNTGANLELIKDGEEGFIYKYGDEDDLRNILTKVIKNYSKFDYIRNNAVNKVVREFDSKINTDKLINKYKKCEEE